MRTSKFLTVLLLIVVAALWGGATNSSAATIPLSAFTGPCSPLPAPSSSNFKARLDAFVTADCYGVNRQNWPHEDGRRSSEGLHDPYVQLWYSPQLYRWMTLQLRLGPIPDGSVVIKEEYEHESDSPICFWSVMIKDSNLWWDGWSWAVVGVEGECLGTAAPPPPPPIVTNGCPEPQFPFNGPTALNCIGCHGSAISGTATNQGNSGAGTFSTQQFVTSATQGNVNATLPFFVPGAFLLEPAYLALLSNGALIPPPTGACMVPVTQDLAASKPWKTGGPSLFVTSNQCASCHDATDNSPGITHMLYPDATALPPVDKESVNLSPFGEWSYSMMGLAGRDPVFFAQLDSESTVHSKIQGQLSGAGFVQDTCLSCHAVMGQRQYHLDKQGIYFTRNVLNDPNSRYAALGRDGVSCNVCHHIAAGNPLDPSTFTGKFNVGPANQVYGPYPSDPHNSLNKTGHNVIPAPMLNGVGMFPVYGAQIASSQVCASCHTIVLPVYNAQGRQVNTDFEQTTYLEWLNSSFGGTNPQSCQDCHMPNTYKGSPPLAYQIANFEDSTFPRVPEEPIPPPFISTTLPAQQLILETRGLPGSGEIYARHQLSGINPFVLDMFDQFRTVLGEYATDGLLPDPLRGSYNGRATAVASAVMEAQQSTASLSVATSIIPGPSGGLQADVTVTNLAGHKFPSGVSFRRAFLDFQVLDGSGDVLWESGRTNNKGVIVDMDNVPLVTESFSTQQTFQPHFWANPTNSNNITTDDQVQIYEELVQDPQGQLTTSFLSLNNKVKDNRILPNGWNSSLPFADVTGPAGGAKSDPSYQGTNVCGCSVVRYRPALSAEQLAAAKTVQVTMYYQTIPPYYLEQRQEDATGPDTQRLKMFTDQLQVGAPKYPEIANWKLQIASGMANITQ
jgi:hypothetical protein